VDVRYVPDDQSVSTLHDRRTPPVVSCWIACSSGTIAMTYCDTDRAIAGGAVPQEAPLALQATKKEMGAAYFTERREAGVVNLEQMASCHADGKDYPLHPRDMLYIGRGTRDISFQNVNPRDPALFLFCLPIPPCLLPDDARTI